MPWSYKHCDWLNTAEDITTEDGVLVKVLEFSYEEDEEVLSAWAKHFRNHYCLDDEIDFFISGTGLSKEEYLTQIKFPDSSKAPGPSIRSGDFSEVLVSDYLDYVMGYWVPRTRYGDKTVRNESTKGCDILGFKFIEEGKESRSDELAILEAKAQFSGRKPAARLQDAVNDSAKDQSRKAESLNAIKQRLFAKDKNQDAKKVERFQNPIDKPYKEISGAIALFDTSLFSPELCAGTNANDHSNQSNLFLIVIHGDDMMKLVHELYKRAANEA